MCVCVRQWLCVSIFSLSLFTCFYVKKQQQKDTYSIYVQNKHFPVGRINASSLSVAKNEVVSCYINVRSLRKEIGCTKSVSLTPKA